MTRGLSIRAIADYGHTHANAALTSIASGRWLTGDVLLTYQANPFTAFFLGYTTGRHDWGAHSDVADRFQTVFELPAMSHQVFAKLSYALRF